MSRYIHPTPKHVDPRNRFETYDVEIVEDTTQKDTYSETHPTYAMVGICHGSGATHLFGSEVDQHLSHVTLKVSRARKIVTGGQVWHYAEAAPLIELRMSPAQYAAMVGTPNSGDGVPCTLVHVGGSEPHSYQDPPRTPHATDHAKKEVEDAGKVLAEKIRDARVRIEAKLGSKVSAKLLAEVLSEFDTMDRHVTANSPYFVTALKESAEKIVSAAKTEVDAFIISAATRLGFQSLRALSEKMAESPKQIIDTKEE
jgi:hypothetical protein